MTDFVKVPITLLRSLERRAARAEYLESTLSAATKNLRGYEITAVITTPSSGDNADKILSSLRSLVEIIK